MFVQTSYLNTACPPGTYGDNCTTSCPNRHYGENCGLKCECTSDERCDPAKGCISITTGKHLNQNIFRILNNIAKSIIYKARMEIVNFRRTYNKIYHHNISMNFKTQFPFRYSTRYYHHTQITIQ